MGRSLELGAVELVERVGVREHGGCAVRVGVDAGWWMVVAGDLDELAGGADPDGSDRGAQRGPAVVLELVGALARGRSVPGGGRAVGVGVVVVEVSAHGADPAAGRAVAGPVAQGDELP